MAIVEPIHFPADVEQNAALVKDTSSAWRPSRQEVLIMLTLAIASFMVALDATIIITSLSTMVRALDATSTQGFWIGTSYLLTSAVTMLFTASLSDVFGRPYLLFASVLTFTIGTILCCTAHSIGLMLTGRSVQGIGGGGIIILSLVIFTDIVPLRFRPQYLGSIQGAWALGTCIGPIIGGAFAQPDLWRWVFYIMFPFSAIALVFIPLFVRLKPREATVRQMIVRIDWLGGFLFISSATSFLVALSWGGTQFSWTSGRTLAPLILGISGLVGTTVWERYGAREPFLRHSIFYCPSAFAVYAGTFAQGLLLYGQLYYIPFFFESVRLNSPIRTGVSVLPVMATLVPAAVVVGRLITRTGSFRWAIWSGFLLTTLAAGLTIMWDAQTGTAAWVVIFIVMGLGHGLVLNALNVASQAVAFAGDEAAAIAMYSFMRNFGMAVGVGLGGTIFQNIMKQKLIALALPREIAAQSEAYIAVLHQLGDTPERRAVTSAYVAGFRGVNGFFCGLAGVAFLITLLFIRHFEIDKELASEHKLDDGNRASWRTSRHSRLHDAVPMAQNPPASAMSTPATMTPSLRTPALSLNLEFERP